MISCGRSRALSASATGSVICNSVNFEYVVESIRKIRMTNRTSMNGIRLISGSSGRGLRKFSAIASARCAGARHDEAQQVRHEPIRRLFHVERVAIDQATEIPVEHQRGN